MMHLRTLKSDRQILESQRVVTVRHAAKETWQQRFPQRPLLETYENKDALQSDYILVVLSYKSCFMIFIIFLPFVPSPTPVLSGCWLWTARTFEERAQANVSEKKPPP